MVGVWLAMAFQGSSRNVIDNDIYWTGLGPGQSLGQLLFNITVPQTCVRPINNL